MDQCGIYSEFRAAVDCAAMNAALLEIWERYLLQCDRRAVFLNNGSESVSGFMGHVPIAAGVEAMAVIREHYTKALSVLSDRHEATTSNAPALEQGR